MTGMTTKEFIDKVYYGDELQFKLFDKTYFIQGNFLNNSYSITIDYWSKDDGTEPPHDYLLNASFSSPQERVKAFEEAVIFNGKTFYEVSDDIMVEWG